VELHAGDGVVVRPLEESDAEQIYALVEAHRPFLARWMPFAVDETLAGTRAFIAKARRQLAEDNGMQAAIVVGGTIVGQVGVHGVDRTHLSAELGYWLAADAQGRGTMTRAVAAFVDHAFSAWGLNRVEIRVDPANPRSSAVPRRLGFVHEGTLRKVERFGRTDRFDDLEIYGMLAADWPGAGSVGP
jgi:ribosomal-protein-serine acetyltransferase